MPRQFPEDYIGNSFSPAVKNLSRLTLSFTKAVGERQDDNNANLVVSPYNALMALSMAAKAADGNTKAEMTKALFGDENADIDAQAADFMALNADILDANKDSVTLSTANAFWVNSDQPGVTLNQQYAADIRNVYDAEVSDVSFSDPATVEGMNRWASDNTNELIPEIVEEGSLTPDMFGLLASSLYFKGDWTSEFDKELTEDKIFTADNGAKLLTAMMHQDYDEDLVRYQDGEDYEAVAMTYGKMDLEQGVTPTMRIVLIRPKDESVSARDWLNDQSEDSIPVWMEPMAYENAKGVVELPHLDMKEKYDLMEPLSDLGIVDAFDSAAADFSPLTEEAAKIYINKAQHDVVFKTDEKGSEAAAITQVGFALECMPPPVVDIHMELNRSFVLMMQDVKTGAPLFIGAVNKPNEDMKQAPQPVVCPRPM